MNVRFYILTLAFLHLLGGLAYGEQQFGGSPFGVPGAGLQRSQGGFGGNGFGGGGFGGGGFGGGGFGGGGGMGGGGGATYKTNPLTQEILKKGEETSKELAKAGEAATKAIAESTKNSQQAIETVLNQPDKTPDIIKNLIEKQKEQDEQKAKSLEAASVASAEQQKRMNSLIDSIVDLRTQTIQASLPPKKESDIRINNPSTGELLSQIPSRADRPSNFGSALSARDRSLENKANNTTPSQGGINSSGSGHSHGGSHGFKSSTSKVYNPPAKDGF